MRIAVATDALFRADGIARAAIRVGAALREAGHEVHLLHPDRPYEQPQLTSWSEIATSVTAVADLSLRRTDLRATAIGVAGGVRSLRRLRPDLIYVHQPAHAMLAASAAARRPTATVLHLHGHPATRVGRAQSAGIKRAHRIVAVSQSVAEAWRQHGLNPHRTTVVHNGVDLGRFSPPKPAERQRAREELGIPRGSPVVGFVGRFTQAKGVEVLVEAFGRVALDHPDAWLVMVGATDAHQELRRDLERRLAGLNHLLLDEADDPRGIMRAFDIGAVPSHNEAFSLVVLEFMAMGIITLGSDVGGTPEALGPGLTHRLTPVGNIDLLASSIGEALHHVDEASVRDAYRLRAQHFEESRWLHQMVDCLTLPAD